MPRRANTIILLAVYAWASLIHAAQPSADQVAFFEQRIRPVLVEHCYECHSASAEKLRGGLLLDSQQGWARGGDSGKPAIIPNDPETSLLLRALRHDDPDMAMPPKKPRLPAAIIQDFEAWIKMGAPDPRTGSQEARRADGSWWSLQPLADPAPPNVEGAPAAWSTNAIDRFVFASLAERNLKPNEPAPRAALLRRVTYDLTGLPPTPAETEAFVNSSDPRAYEKVVERLLASPHYGERWGRHWLDVVRFGESRGFERNEIIPNAWPFRDYVIRSLNDDKPFNQFILEHIAGDIVARDQPETEVGVAFLTMGPYDDVGNQDAVAAANIRAATVDEVVSATGAAFLGLTINCARCHHHKFDPIPTEDYYRMKAAFDGVSHGPRALATKEERAKFDAATGPLHEKRRPLAEKRAQAEKAILDRTGPLMPDPKSLRPPPSAQLTEEKFEPVRAKFVRLNVLAHSGNPNSGAGARMDEFEIWSSGAEPKNVALASLRAKAQGAAGAVAKDFDGAYSVELVNDGKFSSRWFVGHPATLTIELAKPEQIDRVAFSHDRATPSDKPVEGLGPCVTEYELFVSEDGEAWSKVADSYDRAPFDNGLAKQRQLKLATDAERAELKSLDQQIAEIDRDLRKIPPLTAVWAGNFSQPKSPTHVFKGGDPAKPGEIVKPASLAVLAKASPVYELPVESPESDRRLALAKWIASDSNPLTARVLANRVWQHHFGAGIVDTPNDFGFLGGKPSHPELLDYLARRLHAVGWRLKALHREILLSQTYQQSNAYRESAASVDQEARLLWRFPPRRLSAEEIRDTMLALSGALDKRAGGPGFRLYEYKQDNVATYVPLTRHGPETYRRSVYHHNARASVVDILTDFDLPDTAFPAPTRVSTTNPLQTLTLLNHSFVLDMAGLTSERIEREAGKESAAQTQALWRLAFQREPSANELASASKLIETHGLRALCRAILNSNELIHLN